MVERFIPPGAIKISDKNSDAVAYAYSYKGKPAARVFFGRQSKPAMAFFFANEAQRQAKVAAYFASRQASMALKAKRAAERKAKPRKIEVGSFFYTSWGYDQTNIDWYMVTALIGKTMLEVVAVKSMDASDAGAAYMTGKSVPSDQAKGQPFRVRANGDGFKVDRQYASLWDGTPKNWTAYA